MSVLRGEAHNATYRYTDAGTITAISDASRDGTDTQCFTYDGRMRLTQAWTQNTTTCASEPNSTLIGGPAPYWNTYTYDTAGKRKTETRHGIAGQPDTERTYTYATPGNGNRLHKIVQTGAAGTRTDTYSYDAIGNTTAITTADGGHTDSTQAFDWNVEGELDKVTENGNDTTFVYDPDGNRLLRKDTGATTLYLPGGTELRLINGATSPTGTRYYTFAGKTVAMRTTDGVTYLTGDHQGTAQNAINATDQTRTVRRFTPFGTIRALDEDATWPGEKAFVGGTQDPTGLTHLGAREYNPQTGRFISVDPLFNINDAQQANGYTYANNSPIVLSDPDGLIPRCYINIFACFGGSKHTPSVSDAVRGIAEGSLQGLLDLLARLGNWLASRPRAVGQSYADLGYSGAPRDTPRLRLPDAPSYTPPPVRLPGPPVDRTSPSYKVGHIIGGFVGPPIPGVGAVRAPVGIAKIAKHLRGLKNLRKCARKPSSFVPGTSVLMADGTKKAIEDVEIGDKVLATDPETGETKPQPVLDTITTKGTKNLVQITVAGSNQQYWTPDSDGGEQHRTDLRTVTGDSGVVIATDEHPFWVAGKIQDWVKATDLKPGMWLRTSSGTYVQVTATKAWLKLNQRVHNLTIEGLHTYYVLAGNTPVLVHNANDRYDYLNRSGFSNYVLVDRNGRVYYSGMFGGNETPGTVQSRHAGNNNRFSAANGDTMRVMPGTRTYGESRLMEQRLAEQYGTVIGKDGTNYRGNRQNPLAGDKLNEYQNYERRLTGGCP